MRAALIGAVEFNAEHFARQDFDLVVAVDRGFATCQQHGIRPDIAVGDFDSLGYVPDAGEVKVHPSVKDESDMELALRLAHARGYRDVLVYGGLSGRLDHTFANVQLLGAFACRGMQVAAIGDDFAVLALANSTQGPGRVSFDAFDPATLHGSFGPYVSVFALGDVAKGVSERGLKYELDNAVLFGGVSRGLSNEFTGEPAAISVTQGALVVMLGLDAWEHIGRTEAKAD